MKQHYTKIPLFLLLFTLLIYLPGTSKAQCNCAAGMTPLTVVYDTSGLIPPANDSTIYKFPQFDPSIGTLVCVGLEGWVTGIVRMRLENDEIYPVNYVVKYSRTDQITGTGLGSPLSTSLTKNYGPYGLAASDGVYFSGPDYKTIGPDTVVNNKLISTVISSNVTPFLGNGQVNFSYRVTGSTVVTGSSNYIFSVSSIDRLHFRLTYSYCTLNLLAANIRNFTAVKKDNQTVLLNWVTQNEEINNRYEIEYSKDGRNFKTIGTTAAHTEGAADAEYEYQHNLATTDAGKLFYRVKQINSSGQAHYSQVGIITLDEGAIKFAIYPNPAKNRINLEWSSLQSGDIQVEIINNIGQQVFKKIYPMAGNNLIVLDLPAHIGPGLYYVRTKDATNNTQQLTKLLIH
jgi:Secretion system C-terminal sorting domain